MGSATAPLAEFGAQAAVSPALPSIAAQAAPQAATQSASFFDQLTEPKTLLGIGQVGMGMLQGSAAEDMANNRLDRTDATDRYKTDMTYNAAMAGVANKSRELDIAEEKENDAQALIKRRYEDLNAPGGRRGGVEINADALPDDTVATPTSKRQVNRSVDKANVSKQVADILAPKKKPTGTV